MASCSDIGRLVTPPGPGQRRAPATAWPCSGSRTGGDAQPSVTRGGEEEKARWRRSEKNRHTGEKNRRHWFGGTGRRKRSVLFRKCVRGGGRWRSEVGGGRGSECVSVVCLSSDRNLLGACVIVYKHQEANEGAGRHKTQWVESLVKGGHLHAIELLLELLQIARRHPPLRHTLNTHKASMSRAINEMRVQRLIATHGGLRVFSPCSTTTPPRRQAPPPAAPAASRCPHRRRLGPRPRRRRRPWDARNPEAQTVLLCHPVQWRCTQGLRVQPLSASAACACCVRRCLCLWLYGRVAVCCVLRGD